MKKINCLEKKEINVENLNAIFCKFRIISHLINFKIMKKLISTLALTFSIWNFGCFAQNLDVVGDINTIGKVKMNNNAGSAGQVLTSNGASLAPTWNSLATPAVVAGGKFSYRIENVTSQTTANNVDNLFSAAANASSTQSAFVSFATSGGGGIDYNTNSDVTVDTNTGLFTFNRAGLYHFEGMIRCTLGTPNAQVQSAALASNVNLIVNEATTINHLVDQRVMINNGPVGASFTQYGTSIPFEFNRYFTAGGTLRIKVSIFNITNTSALSVLGMNSGSYVAGHFVSE
jgi:hypothetical protein